jgi:hypothetical protein
MCGAPDMLGSLRSGTGRATAASDLDETTRSGCARMGRGPRAEAFAATRCSSDRTALPEPHRARGTGASTLARDGRRIRGADEARRLPCRYRRKAGCSERGVHPCRLRFQLLRAPIHRRLHAGSLHPKARAPIKRTAEYLRPIVNDSDQHVPHGLLLPNGWRSMSLPSPATHVRWLAHSHRRA